MKIKIEAGEVEVTERYLEGLVRKKVNEYLLKQVQDKKFIEVAVGKQMNKYMASAAFKKVCSDTATPLIRFELARVMPGWIKHKIKLMLQAAAIMKEVDDE